MSGEKHKSKVLTIQQVAELRNKIPPQDVEMEKTVLGAILLEKVAQSEVMSLLSEETFYDAKHAKIYAAIQSLYAKGLPIDILTVTNELRKAGNLEYCGGAIYVAKLTDRVGSSANIGYHARILIEHQIKRSLIVISDGIINEAYDDVTDCFDLVDKAVSMMMLVNSNLSDTAGNFKTAAQISKEAHEHYEAVKLKGGDGITGIPSGLLNIDTNTGGWQPGDFIVLAARPGMGKTAAMMQFARNAAIDFKVPVGIVSLEMENIGLMQRMQAIETGINSQAIRKALMTDEEYMAFRSKLGPLENAPIYIDETPGQTINTIRAKAHQLKQKYGIQMLMIDYLQLIEASDNTKKGIREQQVAEISKGLKRLAKELKMPIVALSQLSREVEKRSDKRPQLSDLRESGAIEQDADFIGFLWRPGYYGIKEGANGGYADGYAELIVAKNRNGDLADIKLTFTSATTKFSDYSDFTPPATPTEPIKDYSAAITNYNSFDNSPEDLPF